MLQEVERKCETIKNYAWELRNKGGVHRVYMSQGSRSHTGGCAAMRVGWEVTVGVIVHDGMSSLRPNEVGGRHLRKQLWAIFWKIYLQESIDGQNLGGTVEFEFKRHFKNLRASHKTTFVHLIFERFNRAQSVEH